MSYYTPHADWPIPTTLLGWWLHLKIAADFAHLESMPPVDAWLVTEANGDTVELSLDTVHLRLSLIEPGAAVLAVRIATDRAPELDSILADRTAGLPPQTIAGAQDLAPSAEHSEVWDATPEWVKTFRPAEVGQYRWLVAFYDLGTWWSVDVPDAIDPMDLPRWRIPLFSKDAVLDEYAEIGEYRLVVESFGLVELEYEWEECAPDHDAFSQLLDAGLMIDPQELAATWQREELAHYLADDLTAFRSLRPRPLGQPWNWPMP